MDEAPRPVRSGPCWRRRRRPHGTLPASVSHRAEDGSPVAVHAVAIGTPGDAGRGEGWSDPPGVFVATRDEQLMRSDIVPGGVFPDYELPDHTGELRLLSDIQGDDPMILTLARGHYCPKEHQQHLELAAMQPKLGVAYTRIATIATDERHTLQEFRASVGAQWPFLSDPGRVVQRDLDTQEYTDPANDPMIPHTLVLKPGLVVHSVYNGYWFWGRPSVDDLWRDLRAVTREI